MPPSIKKLPPLVVNQIAAGECISRPSSVIKELVENSLDAGAKKIEVEVEDGGKKLIRVLDDGNGIPPDELPLAFANHATSKISVIEDINSILSFGFRGEALASIGSVSEAKILSRTKGSLTGAQIYNHGGEIGNVEPAGMPEGTIVEVRNLFYNIPARCKFLKSSTAEMGHIQEELIHLAVHAWDVEFSLRHGKRQSLRLPLCTCFRERVLSILGEDYCEKLLEVKGNELGMDVLAYTSHPDVHRPNSKFQYFYINGRSIKNPGIMKAISEAYRECIPNGRYPVVVLSIKMEPSQVDVNVHPTKSEVRFRDPGKMFSVIRRLFWDAIYRSDLASPVSLDGTQTHVSEQEYLKNQESHGIVREKKNEFIPMPLFQDDKPEDVREPESSRYNEPAEVCNDEVEEEIGCSETRDTSYEEKIIEKSPAVSYFSACKQEDKPYPGDNEKRPITNEAKANINKESQHSYFQVHNSYIIEETPDGIAIIDQHALHERFIYNRLKDQIKRSKVASQMLLFPETVTLSGDEMAFVLEHTDLFTQLGIEIESFGPRSLIIRAVPQLVSHISPSSLLIDLIERLKHDGDLSDCIDLMIATMACRAAVKAGDKLSDQEIVSLLTKREEIELSSHCPHGRPTHVKLTLTDLEKYFKRR